MTLDCREAALGCELVTVPVQLCARQATAEFCSSLCRAALPLKPAFISYVGIAPPQMGGKYYYQLEQEQAFVLYWVCSS